MDFNCRKTFVFLCGLFVFCNNEARAGMFSAIGAGENSSMGNTGVAEETGFAAYYNPAAMRTRRTRIDIGYVYSVTNFSWRTQDGEGESDIPDAQGFNVGVIQNLYCFRLPSLNFGFALHVPSDDFFYWKPKLPSSEQFIRYEDDLKHFELYTSLSWWILDTLSVGGGLSATATAITTTDIIYTQEGETVVEKFKRAQTARITADFIPFFGVLYKYKNARFGFRYFKESYLDDHDGLKEGGGNIIDLNGFIGIEEEFSYPHHFTHYYQPHTFTFGTGWDIGAFTFNAEIDYGLWSHYVDTYYNTFKGEERDYKSDFEDIFKVKLGARYSTPNFSLLGGYGYEPSPMQRIPEETGFLDISSHVITMGFSTTFQAPVGKELTLNIFFHYRVFPEKSLTHAGNEKNYTVEGSLWGLGVNLGTEF